jgi:pteridine reductase
MSEKSTETSAPVAVVTGSGRKRIGNYLVRQLADAGYRVAIHYHSSDKEANQTVADLQAKGNVAKAFQADVGNEDDVERFSTEVHTAFGRVDLLVCTASMWPTIKLEDTSTEDILKVFHVDAIGSFLCAKTFGLQMVKQKGGGSIVLFGDWALQRPYLDHAAYFIAKGTIPTMTRMLARELAERNENVRVNAILPGPVLLPEELSVEAGEQTRQATLLKKVDQPDAVFETVRYFADNQMVTGVVMPVDGGRTIYAPEPSNG